MPKSFGEQLRKERTKKGLTVLKVAKDCGLSHSHITLIENGLRLPGKKNIPKIATALQIKPETVLNWYLKVISEKVKSELKIQ